MTHRDPEARFLYGWVGVSRLFQESACLNYATKETKEKGFKMNIQQICNIYDQGIRWRFTDDFGLLLAKYT